jgi:hypothetical protein
MQRFQRQGFRVEFYADAAVKFNNRNHTATFQLHINYYGPLATLRATTEYLNRFTQDMQNRQRYATAMISADDDEVRNFALWAIARLNPTACAFNASDS